MNLTRLMRLMHSRQLLVTMIAVAIVAAQMVTASGVNGEPDEGGLSSWLASAMGNPALGRYIATGISLTCMAGVAVTLVMICKTYNPQRSMSMLWGTMYVAMLLAEPSVLETADDGTLMAVMYAVITVLLFSVYGAEWETRRVFLIFFLLSAGALLQYAFIFYVPMLLVGCLQMRILKVRVVLAALIGVVTPAWIVVGLGLVDPRAVELPTLESVFTVLDRRDLTMTIVATALTAVSGVVFLMLNMVKVIGYNSAARAQNGFLSLSLLLTIALMGFDYRNYAFYLPLLCMLAGYQASHFFASHRSRGMAVAAMIILLIYLALFCWNVLLTL